jgi:PTH2 family peptidyl-tRNA hydrolase
MTHKQVIVLRKDLNMRKGKMVAQGAHASMSALLNFIKQKGTKALEDPRVEPWVNGAFAKICVGVDSEEELLAIYNAGKEAGIISSLIKDSGRTEFNGVPTLTAVCLGPDVIEKIDNITGSLKLL